MDYTYQSYGKLKFFGCPIVSIKKLYPSKFSVGEILYVLSKARVGILEKVAIKKVNLSLIGNEASFIYKDTFNFLHNEYDLCRYVEAQQEVDSFRQYVEDLLLNSDGCRFSFDSRDVLKTLRNLKNLINRLNSNNYKTLYYDVDIRSKDIIKRIDSILLNGGRI